MFIKHWLIDETVSFQNDGYVEFYLLGHNTVHAVRWKQEDGLEEQVGSIFKAVQ